MRRGTLFSFAVLAGVLTGCPKKDESADPVSSAADAKSPPASSRAGDPDDGSFVDSSQMPGRIHVVEPKDTLLQLAERYYRDRNQWRRIWQANKNRISDPNDLPVGMKLIIP